MTGEKTSATAQCPHCYNDFKAKGLAAHVRNCPSRTGFGGSTCTWVVWNPCSAVWVLFLLFIGCKVVLILFHSVFVDVMMGHFDQWVRDVLTKYLGIYMNAKKDLLVAQH